MGQQFQPFTAAGLKAQLQHLPLIAAPMFLVSNPQLVIACARNGVPGTFPALNARTSESYEAWLQEITQSLTDTTTDSTKPIWGVNLIVHKTNSRLEADLALTERFRVPLVITSLGAATDIVERVHRYGGLVLHDVTTVAHARKALDAGVDGLIAVSAGAGGHAGTLNPFSFVSELRAITDKLIVLAGGMSSGAHVAAAKAAGADLAYMGTRFIASTESMASAAYKEMVTETDASDIVYTPKISGIHANFIGRSIAENGLDVADMPDHGPVDLETELNQKGLAWKHIWSAGHGVGGVSAVQSAAEICQRLKQEYSDAVASINYSPTPETR